MKNELDFFEDLANINFEGKKIKEIFLFEDISLFWFSTYLFRTYFNLFDKTLEKKIILSYYIKKLKEFLIRKIYKNKKYITESKILFLSEYSNWKNILSWNGKIKFENELLQPVTEELKKEKINYIKILEFPYRKFGYFKKIFTKEFEKITKTDIPYDIFLDKNIIKIEKKHKKIYLEKLKELKSNNMFKKMFIKKYGRLEYKKFIIFLRLCCYKIFPESIRYILVWKKIINKLNPKCIILSDEASIPGRALVIAGKKKKIPTIALQHGIITRSHQGYYHKPKNISKSRLDFINCCLPDMTCVYGKYEKNILKDFGYKKSAIKITGAPRYDILKNKIFDKNKILKKYKLPKNKKIILWATQTHNEKMQKSGENEKNVKTIFRVFSKLKDEFHLVIKLHPNEDQRAPLYKKYNKKYDNIATIIGRGGNTFELIYISDMVITKSSTVGIEAIIMKKPLILAELIKSYDLSTYKKYGVPVFRNKIELTRYLKLAKTKKYLKNFEKMRKKFIDERISFLGCSTKKLIKIIEKKFSKK